MATGKPSLVIVEDHGAVLAGLSVLLTEDGYRVAASCRTAEEGLQAVAEHEPDVAVVDIGLPDGSGLDIAKAIKAEHPGTTVLLYTASEDPDLLLAAIDGGAEGFALKGGSHEELRSAIDTLSAGGMYLDPRLGAAIALGNLGRAKSATLRRREREILGLIARGQAVAEVSTRLAISDATVRSHLRNAMNHLGARTRAHAVALALATGQISMDDAAP